MARTVAPPLSGLSHGWEGASWAALQKGLSGVTRVERRFLRQLERRLIAAVATRNGGGPSHLIGSGGVAVVALLASQLDARFAPIAQASVERWTAADCPPTHDDVLLGHPGALLALAELADQLAGFSPPAELVRRGGERTNLALRRALASSQPQFVGLAHGLAGLLLAAECGAARLGCRRDDELMDRAFERLAECRLWAPGVGAIWTSKTDQDLDQPVRSWCHGAPGIALALHSCFRLTGRPHYRALFDEAISTVLALPSPGGTFCCGQTGRAQILIEIFRQTGDRAWLTRARAVAGQPTTASLSREYPEGFAQGGAGMRYLEDRLAAPDALPLPATGFSRSWKV